MSAGSKHVCYALMNHSSKEIVEFGYYALQSDNDFATIFSGNKIFTDQYPQSVICFNVAGCVLVPAEFFRAENAEMQINVVCGDADEPVLLTDYLQALNIYIIYKVPFLLHTAATKRFNADKFRNINSVLLNQYAGNKEETILIDFRTDEFSVIVFKNKLLQLAQTFIYFSPEDVLYSLLKICRQLNLPQQDVHVSIAGLVDKDSAMYRELHKYFIHLEFEEPPGAVKIAEELNMYPHHYYSTICKLASCV